MAYATRFVYAQAGSNLQYRSLNGCHIVELASGKLVVGFLSRVSTSSRWVVRIRSSADSGATWAHEEGLLSANSRVDSWYLSPPLDDGDVCALVNPYTDSGAIGSEGYSRTWRWDGSQFVGGGNTVRVMIGSFSPTTIQRIWAQAINAGRRITGVSYLGGSLEAQVSVTQAGDLLDPDTFAAITLSGVARQNRWLLPYAWRHTGDGRTPVNAASDGRIEFYRSNSGAFPNDFDGIYTGPTSTSRIDLSALHPNINTTGAVKVKSEHAFGDGSKLWMAVDGTSSQQPRLLSIPYSLMLASADSIGLGSAYRYINGVTYFNGKAYVAVSLSAGNRGSAGALLEVNLSTKAVSVLEAAWPATEGAQMYPLSGVVRMLSSVRDSSNRLSMYERTLASAPDAPVIVSPTAGVVLKLGPTASLQLDWTFSATDGSDQSKVEIRRLVGGEEEYWNGAVWVGNKSSATKRNLTTTDLTFTAAQWLRSASVAADGTYPDHYFWVRVSGTLAPAEFSPWSGRVIVRPSVASVLSVESFGGIAYVDATTRLTIESDFAELIWSVSPDRNERDVYSYVIRAYRYRGDDPANAAALYGTWTADSDVDPTDSLYHHTQRLPVRHDGLSGYLDLTVMINGQPTNTVRVLFDVEFAPGVASTGDIRAVRAADFGYSDTDAVGLRINLEWPIVHDASIPGSVKYDYVASYAVDRIEVDPNGVDTGVVEPVGSRTLVVDTSDLPVDRSDYYQTAWLLDLALRHDTEYRYRITATTVRGRLSVVELS